MYTIAMKRVIGLDFDDVLMDLHEALHPYCNPRYNANLSRDQLTHYRLNEFWGCTVEELERRVVDFYHSEAHHNAKPVRGAPEAVRELSKNNSLVVITSRPQFIKEKTLEWLTRHYGDLFDQVYFTNLFAGGGAKKTKAEVCRELGVDVFVDDHIDYARDVAQTGKKVLLYNAPWNQSDELHPNITRVESWDHILSHLAQSSSYNK